MKVTPTAIADVLLIEPQVFGDERGFFYESYHARRFHEMTGVRATFVQDNRSKSAHQVLRGLHYQINQPQGKLVEVTAGAVFDVVVDLRRSSASFGQWMGIELSAGNRRQLWVPPGFAHGFLVTSDSAECVYKTTDYWAPEHERAIRWNDPQLAIGWPLDGPPVLSERDAQAGPLATAEVFP